MRTVFFLLLLSFALWKALCSNVNGKRKITIALRSTNSVFANVSLHVYVCVSMWMCCKSWFQRFAYVCGGWCLMSSNATNSRFQTSEQVHQETWLSPDHFYIFNTLVWYYIHTYTYARASTLYIEQTEKVFPIIRALDFPFWFVHELSCWCWMLVRIFTHRWLVFVCVCVIVRDEFAFELVFGLT